MGREVDINVATIFHELAMNLAEGAIVARVNGDVFSEKLKGKVAAQLECLAVEYCPNDISKSVNMSILSASAAVLLKQYGCMEKAVKLARKALKGPLPNDYRSNMEGIVAQAQEGKNDEKS